MRTFNVTTEGENRLGLRELCQRFADDEWVADILTDAECRRALVLNAQGLCPTGDGQHRDPRSWVNQQSYLLGGGRP